jgi:hypothetical protein
MTRFTISALFGLLTVTATLLAYILYQAYGSVVISAILLGVFVGAGTYLLDLLTEPKPPKT